MLESLNNQKTPTINQIKTTRPNIANGVNVLQGYIANSCNGGMIRPIGYKRVMAGEKHIQANFKGNFKMVTPISPNYCRLKGIIDFYFVPDSAVWDNAERFWSQKGGASEIKIEDMPNLVGKPIPYAMIDGEYNSDSDTYPITDTTLWRDCWASSYIPRYMYENKEKDARVSQNEWLGKNSYWKDHVGQVGNEVRVMERYSVLPLRGFKSIYNNFLRNKEYDEPMQEYKGDTVTNEEWLSFFPYGNSQSTKSLEQTIVRGKKQNSYYTNYRLELLGDQSGVGLTDNIVIMTEWLQTLSEKRAESANSQKNDWDIIAELGGTRAIKDTKPQHLGRKVFTLDQQAITQSAYNVNEMIEEQYQAMGEQGAYSYTEVNLQDCYNMTEFKENGTIHIIFQAVADTVYERGMDRTLMNTTAMEQYRPDLSKIIDDTLKAGEMGYSEGSGEEIIGYKRKFSEYFKAPNVIGGDMTNEPYYKNSIINGQILNPINKQLTNHAYQYFESDFRLYKKPDGEIIQKSHWKDYTDLLINENRAIQQSVGSYKTEDADNTFINVDGSHQIFFVGMQEYLADLPIDNTIKENYISWGGEI